MLHQHNSTSHQSKPKPKRRRWLPTHPNNKESARRRLTRRGILTILITTTLAILIARRLNEPPRVVPPFESIIAADAASGPIKDFALKDIGGNAHNKTEWASRPAIVLFFIAVDCPVSNGYAPVMTDLAHKYASHNVLFYGIHTDPDLSPQAASQHATEFRLSFPILLDHQQIVARQAGVRVTPEALVLIPDGQVLYRGRIDDRYAPDGKQRPAPTTFDLETAIAAAVHDELPAVSRTRAFGCPLPRILSDDTAEEITFSKHIAPILYQNCAKCHRPGDVAPFPLLTYKDAAKRADFLYEVVTSGRMPPWKPHPGAGVFLDAATISQREKELLAIWAENGCPQGNPAELPPLPKFNDDWKLGNPDLVIEMPEPFNVPIDQPDLYWAFQMPFPLDHPVTIRGVEFQPGNRRVVHHSRIHHEATGDARKLDREQPGPGFSGFYGNTLVDLPYPGIGAWTPGITPRFAPNGTGKLISPGSDIVFSIHYHSSGKPETDQSRVALYYQNEPVTRGMTGLSLCTDRINIPAGVKQQTMIISTRLKADVHLYTVVPHAHYLCREFRLAATLPDGIVQPLLWITDWNLDWQDQYRYAKPVRLPKGTLLTFSGTFDNSSDNPRNPNKPPARVRYGVGSKDEMFACHLEWLPDDASGYAAYPNKSPFGL